MVYSDESASSIVSWSGSNDVKVGSEMNAVFSLLKAFCFCLVHHHETSSVNLIKGAATSAKDLMNCQ